MAEGEQHIEPAPSKSKITLPKAAAIGAVAGLAPTIVDAVRGAEANSSVDNIIFEPGIHITDVKEFEQVIEDFYSGDPDAHAWQDNPQLTQRLAEYKPQVLAVDGLSPTPKNGNLDKGMTWIKIPGRPRNINPLGFYTVLGDNTSIDIGQDLNAWEGQPLATDEHSYLNELSEDVAAADNAIYNKFDKTFDYGVAAAISAGVLALGVGTVHRATKETGRHHTPTKSKRGLTRRTLLKAGAVTAGVVATRGLWNAGSETVLKDGAKYESQATTDSQRHLWEVANNYLSEIPQEAIVDGRTALLIAKQQDAIEYLKREQYLPGDARGAVVMGDGHSFHDMLFLRDKHARDEAMRAYARHVIAVAEKVASEHYDLPKDKMGQLTKHLLEFLSRTDIVHVSDPGLQEGGDLQEYVRQNITPIESFESGQVKNAVSRLSFDQAVKLTSNS